MRPCLRKQPQINTTRFFISVLRRAVLPSEQVCLLGLIKVQRVWLSVLSDPNIQELTPPHAPALYKERANSSDLSRRANADQRQGAEITFIAASLLRSHQTSYLFHIFTQTKVVDCNRRCINKAGLKINITSCLPTTHQSKISRFKGQAAKVNDSSLGQHELVMKQKSFIDHILKKKPHPTNDASPGYNLLETAHAAVSSQHSFQTFTNCSGISRRRRQHNQTTSNSGVTHKRHESLKHAWKSSQLICTHVGESVTNVSTCQRQHHSLQQPFHMLTESGRLRRHNHKYCSHPRSQLYQLCQQQPSRDGPAPAS